MLVWLCREQRLKTRKHTGLQGGLPEGKERTEDHPEGGQGGSAAAAEPGEAAQGEGGTEPRRPRYRKWSVGPKAEEASDRMSWGKAGFSVRVSSVEAATLLFVKERDLLETFCF